ncbi:MAG TPA: hypothetical protein DCR30_11470, partial [Afipia sp.]|nr:hypothetical protein [Afipia sp.]
MLVHVCGTLFQFGRLSSALLHERAKRPVHGPYIVIYVGAIDQRSSGKVPAQRYQARQEPVRKLQVLRRR